MSSAVGKNRSTGRWLSGLLLGGIGAGCLLYVGVGAFGSSFTDQPLDGSFWLQMLPLLLPGLIFLVIGIVLYRAGARVANRNPKKEGETSLAG